MPRQELWNVLEDGEWMLDYAGEWHIEDVPAEEVNKHPCLTLEEIADFSDGRAEGRNNHTLVGTHRILAACLHKKLGREQATEIMREIAEYGGLDGMSGAGAEPSAFADFGIKDCWKDWRLQDKDA